MGLLILKLLSLFGFWWLCIFTGSGFVSQDLYQHGIFSASIKLPADYTSGVVAFYARPSRLLARRTAEIGLIIKNCLVCFTASFRSCLSRWNFVKSVSKNKNGHSLQSGIATLRHQNVNPEFSLITTPAPFIRGLEPF
ncbi:hypothetical protein ACFX2C_010026 [Malus domestica]